MAVSGLSCEYAGCGERSSLERCKNADGRLVCPAHRRMLSGSYVCAVCEQEAALAAEVARQQEAIAAEMSRREAVRQEGLIRNKWLVWGSILTFFVVPLLWPIIGAFLFPRSEGRQLVGVIGGVYLLLYFVTFPVSAAMTRFYQHGRLAQGGVIIQFLSWFTALPGIIGGFVFLVFLIGFGSAAKSSIERERRVSEIKDGVQRAIRE